MNNPTVNVLDAWMSGYKALNWNQDQVEKLSTTWIDQAHTMRHDGEKVLEVMVNQAKHNVEEMQQVAKTMLEAVPGEMQQVAKTMLEAVPGWDVLTQADLRRQVAELNARLDAVKA
jgi:polyhydroxyalkanoate synthesis regulator phasin